MKNTIEINDYTIVIDTTEESITVTATKDEEVIEEFSLELSEEVQDDLELSEEDQDDFEDDFEDGFEDDEDDFEDDEEIDPTDSHEKTTLESFNTFIRKRK